MLKSLRKSSPLYDLSWIRNFLDDHNLSEENRERLILFWTRVFRDLLLVDKSPDKGDFSGYDSSSSDSDSLSPEEVSRINRALTRKEFFQTPYKVKKEYRGMILQKLLDAKKEELNYAGLKALQEEIEKLTISYQEESFYHNQPALMRLFINSDLPSAKDYLKGKYKVDRSGDTPSRIKILCDSNGNPCDKGYKDLLTPEEKRMLSVFGPYTLEWLLIHVLSSLFSLEGCVRCASLIERIDSLVRRNAHILLKDKDEDKGDKVGTRTPVPVVSKKRSNDSISYPFGTALVEFLVERGLIDFKVVDVSVQDGIPDIKKKEGRAYRPSALYVECKFDPSLLPMKLQLPMVCLPREWDYDASECQNSEWLNICSLSGGYLNEPLNEGHCLMSSGDISNFFIYFGKTKKRQSHEKAKTVCVAMNKLQNQGFKIISRLS